jgi:ADP-ribose pyrophosphatase YjhB (NUDIX family)
MGREKAMDVEPEGGDREAAAVAWFNALAALQVASACVLRDVHARVLIVQPVYKSTWELPGGALEAGESPLQACVREVAEELRLEIHPSRLLCVDHQTMRLPRRDALRFLFDGGVADASTLARIALAADELMAWKLVPLEEIDLFLKPTVANRLRWGLRCPGVYLENGRPLGEAASS